MVIKWKNEIVYQIFPERFCNGDPSNDVRTGEYMWRGRTAVRSSDPARFDDPRKGQCMFYGGDLAGITQKIPYLKELGITAVYLNPIFASHSTHKYDTDDYFTVDPHFGTRAEYETMVRHLHDAGIRVVLDGVFNHTSFHHPWYRGLRTRRRFYCMKNCREPMTWMNFGSLPKLNVERPQVEAAILRVIDAWPEIDGWRLDAAHLLPASFMRKLKRRIEAVRRNNIVIMEDWTDSYFHFKDGLCDGVTNFLFSKLMERYFVEDCSPETLFKRIATFIDRYPWANAVQNWNHLANHDTSRFPDRIGGRMDRFRLAQALQFTLPGTPLIFQGDEIGMTGRTEAACRRPMEWDSRKWNREVLEHTRRMTRLRRTHPVLSAGRWKPLDAVNHSRVLVFERRMPSGERAVIAMNDGYTPQTAGIGRIRRRLAPHSYFIWISDRSVTGRFVTPG